jgi:hypothetical protein
MHLKPIIEILERDKIKKEEGDTTKNV